MKSSARIRVASVLFAALISPAGASPIGGTNSTPVSIPDLGSVSSTINIAAPGIVNSLSVTIAIAHTFIGDLILSLSHGGTTIVLMNRPGTPPGTFGDNANLSESFPITFSASGLQSAESMGSGCTSTNDVIGSAAGCLNTSFLPEESFAAFFGQSAMGDWTLTISDNAGADVGRLASWTLNGEVGGVPEPGTLALLGLGLAGLAASRRRRQ